MSKNTYFEDHLRMTASEFIGDTTLLHETILKKYTNGKTNFQDGKEYNQKQHIECTVVHSAVFTGHLVYACVVVTLIFCNDNLLIVRR